MTQSNNKHIKQHTNASINLWIHGNIDSADYIEMDLFESLDKNMKYQLNKVEEEYNLIENLDIDEFRKVVEYYPESINKYFLAKYSKTKVEKWHNKVAQYLRKLVGWNYFKSEPTLIEEEIYPL